MALSWHWSRFADLGVDALYDALALRCEVFIMEQGAYLDLDGLDRVAWHLLGRDDAGQLRAYLRVIDPGHKYAEPALGRVVLHKSLRGSGAAKALLAEGLRQVDAVWPGQGCRISAQAHLERYYGAQGFEAVGQPYLEDDIPHVQMFRSSKA